jgi:Na+/H+ antiporter NhaD/arsenite permease-like protein
VRYHRPQRRPKKGPSSLVWHHVPDLSDEGIGVSYPLPPSSLCSLHSPTVESLPQPLGYSLNSRRPIWVGNNHILFISCIFISPVASAVLISSNPTNLVLSGAFSISFVTYTSSVALPFLTAALIVYLYLFMVPFRSVEYIPRNIELSAAGGGVGDGGVGIDRPSTALIDKSGAIFGSILLMATLGALTGSSTVGIPVWQVAVPAAAMMLCRDLWRDWRRHRAERVRAIEQAGEQSSVSPSSNAHPEIELQGLPLSASRSNILSPVRHSRRQLALSTILSTWPDNFVQIFPTVHAIYRQLPISLVPFAFLMFILVQGLASQGWVHVLACWWETWVNKTGVVGAVGGMMIGSGLLCNVCHLVSCRVQSSRHFRYVARISARPFF